MNNIFDKLNFDMGWKCDEHITLFNKDYLIVLKFHAYYKDDMISNEQKESYGEYEKNKEQKKNIIEKLLCDYSNEADNRFEPKMLLFERDGSYALLCDDVENEDEGIAICLYPKEKIMSQDDYL